METWQPRKLHLSVLTLFPDVEWMPIHTRAHVGTLIGYSYSLGQFLLAGVAYAVPHWRQLQLLVSVPFFAFFIYSWYVRSRVGKGATGAQRAARDKTSFRSHETPTPQNQTRSKPKGQTQTSA